MDKSSLIVVADAGPIIHLDELGCLDVLADFGRVIVPETVWLEVQRHRPLALELALLRDIPKRTTLHLRPALLAQVVAEHSYTLCRHKLNFLNALALTLSRRERGL
jgi:hypothetical protein